MNRKKIWRRYSAPIYLITRARWGTIGCRRASSSSTWRDSSSWRRSCNRWSCCFISLIKRLSWWRRWRLILYNNQQKQKKVSIETKQNRKKSKKVTRNGCIVNGLACCASITKVRLIVKLLPSNAWRITQRKHRRYKVRTAWRDTLKGK